MIADGTVHIPTAGDTVRYQGREGSFEFLAAHGPFHWVQRTESWDRPTTINSHLHPIASIVPKP